jgi:hypothetical protein
MKKTSFFVMLGLSLTVIMSSCGSKKTEETVEKIDSTMINKVNEFALVELKADLSHLSEKERQMIPILIEIADIMDELFWMQSTGNKEELMSKISDEWTKKYAEINYGAWDRLKDNASFVEGIGEKPKGSQFYPADMTKEEFEALVDPNKANQYTVIRRKEDKSLEVIWYSEYYKTHLEKAVTLLGKASELAEDAGLKKYLELTAKAFMSNDYFERDMAWMDMRSSNIDFVVGPIENYEDGLFGYKTAFEAFVLLKDLDWSAKLEKFNKLLPKLQAGLPCDAKYKKEVPAAGSDIGVYQAIYYAGDCNAASKSIAINLPNDEKVQLKKGSRKLQLKNSMQAKFDKIVIPIGDVLIVEGQRKNIKFDAFFQNTMFHEVAHGMGIKNTITKKGTIREALKDTYSAIEEDKADIMGLYLAKVLHDSGDLTEGEVMDNYVTFVAGLFRSIRFGTASAHGKANLARYNFFMEKGAITRNEQGQYAVDFDKMTAAMNELIAIIMKIQGEGDYDAAKAHLAKYQVHTDDLNADIEKVANSNIPRDIVFKQGLEVLGLK